MMRGALYAIVIALALFPGRGWSGGWIAPLVDSETGPHHFVAIDKNSQTFFLFERKSPLRVVEKLPCTTGLLTGDKLKEGDLRTPEGVYFITSRLDGGLDWEQYGDLAFPLNFPNPVDVIKGKSGHGIWIHGRGNSITPYETKGCVALNTPDIRNLDAKLELRMPVVIGNRIETQKTPETLAREAEEVVAATHAWAKAWEGKSEEFFKIHDQEKFAISQGQPFSAFRNQKEGLFRRLPWILVAVEDVRAVAGPDYWVTYFIQFYRSPSLISQGVKRLYWQKNDAGAWRVVGMEFEQMPATLAGKYIKPGQIVLAAAETGERERETPVLDKISEEDPRSATDAPATAYAPSTAAAHLATDAASVPAPAALPATPSAAQRQPALSAPALSAQPAAPHLSDLTQLAEAATPRPSALFASLAPSLGQKSVPPAVPATIPTVEPPAEEIVVEKVPVAEKAEAPQPAPDERSQIASLLENWRAAWEHGDVDSYMAFYGNRAVQGDRRGLEAIRDHKVSLWAEKPPRSVRMEDVRVAPRKNGWRVEFVQVYESKDGFGDKGLKKMVLVKAGPRYIIVDEQWSRM
ncbi:L,D-transpeptidase Cds6 family protein [Desulfolutivibrio sulfoxidireducens]|uniref:L,D-transpeptidase Cds6 family protein n=1 Tax=Desulfolutivibrio sulfoxidireducens TaxID=2773299 RepID=UPI00159D235E|nr:L,D-transpeptidase family protein [Desulfolutivibrio sulfoxidireducens]QLA17950.1 L,D-transpeptidase family protein [Desulfolutivibrio sulfoxidireducens]